MLPTVVTVEKSREASIVNNGRTAAKSTADLGLPDDWWQYMSASQGLAQWFGRHLLGLLVEIDSHGTTHCGVFSGFLLDHLEYLWWVTAGHVIERTASCGQTLEFR